MEYGKITDPPAALLEVAARPMGPWGSSESGDPLARGAGHVVGDGDVVHGNHYVQCGGGLCGAVENVVPDEHSDLDDGEVQGYEEQLLQDVEDEGGLGRVTAVPNEVG